MKLTMAYRRFAEEFFEITGRSLTAHYVDAETMGRLWGEFYVETERACGPAVAMNLRQEDSVYWPLPLLEIHGIPVRLAPDLADRSL